MRIVLNGEAVEVAATRLSDILVECGYQQDRIATALNGEIVHRQLREQRRQRALGHWHRNVSHRGGLFRRHQAWFYNHGGL